MQNCEKKEVFSCAFLSSHSFVVCVLCVDVQRDCDGAELIEVVKKIKEKNQNHSHKNRTSTSGLNSHKKRIFTNSFWPHSKHYVANPCYFHSQI